MVHRPVIVAAAVVGSALLAACAAPLGSARTSLPIRAPAVAGEFYPLDRAKLEAAIDQYLAEALPYRGESPPVIIVPHAGYLFSGQIAADAFVQVSRMAVDTVVILGANHTTAGFDRASVYDGDALRTPLGTVQVDRELAMALVQDGDLAVPDRRLHEREHSVEVHVPFVQRVFPGARVVPVVVATGDPEACARFGRVLADAVRGRRALIVASSDLAHYPPAEAAARVDAATLERVARMDVGGLVRAERGVGSEVTPGLVTRACGLGPILVAIEAARRLGAARGIVLSYANSSAVAVGTLDRVVGYGAVAFAPGHGEPDLAALNRPRPDASGQLTAADRQVLLALARNTIARYLTSETLPLPRGGSAALLREAGAFVTVRKNGDLRGCVGRLLPEGPLIRLVSAMAFESAFRDPRFGAVRARELPSLELEVAVLTPLTPVQDFRAIVPGRDGVVLQAEGRSAVFLPQVATEQGWGRKDLLDNLAVKAGLHQDAWRSSGARLLTFQAEVFNEAGLEQPVPMLLAR